MCLLYLFGRNIDAYIYLVIYCRLDAKKLADFFVKDMKRLKISD